MQKFVTVLMQWGIGFAVALVGLLLLICAALIWQPEILVKIVRLGVAVLCLAGAVWILVFLLMGVCKRK